MIKLIYKIKRGGLPMNKKELMKINKLLTSTFVRVGGGQKSNLNIINNNINKDYEITNRNISDFS